MDLNLSIANLILAPLSLYIELYKTLLGKDFNPAVGNVSNRIKKNLSKHGII